MTKEQAQRILKNLVVIQAFAKGASIEYRRFKSDTFCTSDCFAFDDIKGEYRVKREPRVFWVNAYPNGDMFLHQDEDTARDLSASNKNTAEIIKLVEVLDD